MSEKLKREIAEEGRLKETNKKQRKKWVEDRKWDKNYERKDIETEGVIIVKEIDIQKQKEWTWK